MVRIAVPVQQSHCMKTQFYLTTFFGFLGFACRKCLR
jgi:hypothetical protein